MNLDGMKSKRLARFVALAALVLLSPGCVLPTPTRAPVPLPANTPPPEPVAARASTAPLQKLLALAPEADPRMLESALRARQCAIGHGQVSPQARLAVIDYSLPSTARRLWVFDLQRPRLLYREYVAHGRNSGGNLASRFSNEEGSLESSLGLYLTAETYTGDNGYSLRMDGLDPGFNDHARERAIVMHGAWYVDPALAASQGRLGRSLGCPALRPGVAPALIDDLKQGQLLFAWYPDREWMARSRQLNCDAVARAEPLGERIHAMAH
jgi:hypothetical protein